MIVFFIASLLLNIANPSMAESFQAFQPVLKHTAQEILISTESARLGKNHALLPTTKPTALPHTELEQSEQSASDHDESEVQKVAAVNTSSGKVITQVSEKAVENSPVLEPCTADICDTPQTPKKDGHKPLTPTPTDILPTPTPEIPPIKITLPPPCPIYPADKNNSAHTDIFIPCLDNIAH